MNSINILKVTLLGIVAIVITSSDCQAQTAQVSGGVVSIDLNGPLLSGAGFTFSNASETVTSPRGSDFLGFAINSRDDAINPTTFEYEVTTLSPVAGQIESSGSIFFNQGTPSALEIGDIQFDFDASRINTVNSGFFGRSTTGTFTDVIFDIGFGSSITAEPTTLAFDSGIFLAPEFAALIPGDDFTGTNIGSFAIDANATAVPEPTGLGCFAVFGITLTMLRRRKRST